MPFIQTIRGDGFVLASTIEFTDEELDIADEQQRLYWEAGAKMRAEADALRASLGPSGILIESSHVNNV